MAQMDGLQNTTTALKAYMNDRKVWGGFALPKNQIILVISVSDDGQFITGRGMETGMPFGNMLVMQRVRMSLKSDDKLPLTPENLFGSFNGYYTSASPHALEYTYTDMAKAGAITGLLYEETPGYEPPDVNSDECETAPPEHYGFIRYQMCTQEYRKTNIQINEDGALLIIDKAIEGAKQAVPIWWSLVILGVSIALAIFAVWTSAQSGGSYRRRRYRRY